MEQNPIFHKLFINQKFKKIINITESRVPYCGYIKPVVLTLSQILLLLLILLITAIEFSLGGSSSYTLTRVQTKQIRINIHKRNYIKETIQKHSTNNTKHSKCKYTYYNTSTHITTQVCRHILSLSLQGDLFYYYRFIYTYVFHRTN
jgi:hypothetical protein